MKKIGSLLWRSIVRAGLEKELAAALVLEEFKKVLVKKFGKKILNKVKILYLKNQTLTLSVLSSVIAQEIKLNEGKFLKKINQKFSSLENRRGGEFGKKLVERLRFLAR